MNSKERSANLPPTKLKILKVATELFYRQGYNATGVQQIISEAEVSKGTFYNYFKSKDELGLLYLETRSDEEMEQLKSMLLESDDPYQRYLMFTPAMKKWMEESNYRGCAFSNMAAEVPDGNSPLRKAAKHHYKEFLEIIEDMIKDLLASDKKYSMLNLRYVTDQFMMIQVGALTNCEIFQDVWPYEHAEKAVRVLIGEEH